MSQHFKNTLIVAVAVAGVALIGVTVYQYQSVLQTASQKENKPISDNSTEEIALPKPTGKIDDVVGATIAGIEAEAKIISEEESQAQSALDDSQEINDFGQIYDENEIR